MRTPTEHIKTLRRRVDFLKAREYRNSYDAAELGSLEWALVNLPQQRTWVGLTNEEQSAMWDRAEKRQAYQGVPALAALIQEVEAKLKELNT